MDDERWRRISSLFSAALERDPDEREAFLRATGDPELQREVASLLAAHEAPGPVDRLADQMERLRRDALASSGREPGRPASGGGARERSPSLDPGQRLGRHEIRSRLGAGGMGEVYRAYDTRLQREVAIKVLGRRVRQRPGVLQRFEEEARAVSALNHPNIVTLYDIGEEASSPYIVMELIEGRSLRQMPAGAWPRALLLQLGVQMADALVAAHERQIVHGDLKPENILVNPQGTAKIVDFGLARFRLAEEGPGADAGAPAAGALLGTPGYLPPEVVAGAPLDGRSDQFALGAILYEMATGRPAFPGGTALETLACTLREEPRPLAEARPDLPPLFVQAVMRCLCKAPADRHPSTRGLLDDLRAAQREAIQAARPGPARRPGALPAQRTRLIGRRRELDEIERLLADKGVRLLTLAGPGGTGKTRLALQAAQALSPRFPGGVYFVPLASLTDGTLVAGAIAQAVGAEGAADRSWLAGVIGELRNAGGPTLIVLDNFEQVIEAAPAVGELLAACPDLTVMVTSREVLRLYGEHGFTVSPLELPDPARLPPPESLGECPAVALFVERAQAANPAFCLTEANAPAVAALCAGLDGLPLALELAAAQARVLAPEAMLSRLENRLQLLTGGARDLPGRQQTLRRTLDWSHQLLNATEQALFRRLAVFAGGFTLEAAQAVADPYATLDLPMEEGITALMNKSLLQARDPVDGEARFLMLETLREYALEKLVAEDEEEKTRKAHAAYFLVLAEEGARAPASSREQPQWLKRLDLEHDNLRGALEWLVRGGQVEWGLRLGLALFHFWERGEHLVEGRRRLSKLLDLEGARAFPAQHAKALFAASVLAFDQGDREEGRNLAARSLAIYRELGDRWGIGVVLMGLGNHYASRGEHEQARVALEESLQIWEQLGDHTGFARSLSNLAFVARGQGRFVEARSLYEKAGSMFEGLGDRLSHAWTMNHEGDVAREQGDLAGADSLYEGALNTFRSLDNEWGIATSLADLGTTARQQRDYAAARRLYGEALAGFLKLDHRRGVARLLESLACLAAEEGDAARGVQLAAAAAVLRDRIGAPPPEDGRAELEVCLADMQRRLGREAAGLWHKGTTLSVEEAFQLAAGEPRAPEATGS